MRLDRVFDDDERAVSAERHVAKARAQIREHSLAAQRVAARDVAVRLFAYLVG